MHNTPHELKVRMVGGLRCDKLYKYSYPDKPLISIITVVYNGDKHLEKTIVSVVNQSYDNIEYIVIDGGSTDKTVDIIKKYSNLIDYWLSEPDEGIYAGMNKGIALATGDLIGIINSDDYYLEDAIEKIAFAAIQYQEANVFHANLMKLFPDKPAVIYYSKQRLSKDDVYIMPVNHPTVFVRRECYNKYGVFDTKYKYVADYDLILRYLLDHKIVFHYLDEITVCMNWGGASCIRRWQDVVDLDSIFMSKNPSLGRLLHWKYAILRHWISLVWLKNEGIARDPYDCKGNSFSSVTNLLRQRSLKNVRLRRKPYLKGN